MAEQRRYLKSEESELRVAKDDNWHIRGYAAVFNQETELWPGFREKISPGAFRDSIMNDDVRALFNHDPSQILGRNTAGTLKLWEDERGLAYEIIANPLDPDAQRIVPKIKRGDVSQSSFGFNIIEKSVDVNEKKDEMTRTIRKAQLFDVSPVTYPAYPQTSVNVRMTTNENECRYLVGDEVIETVMLAEPEKAKPALSDEQLFGEIDEVLKRTFKR